jgi:hypothetical protein
MRSESLNKPSQAVHYPFRIVLLELLLEVESRPIHGMNLRIGQGRVDEAQDLKTGVTQKCTVHSTLLPSFVDTSRLRALKRTAYACGLRAFAFND